MCDPLFLVGLWALSLGFVGVLLIFDGLTNEAPVSNQTCRP